MGLGLGLGFRVGGRVLVWVRVRVGLARHPRACRAVRELCLTLTLTLTLTPALTARQGEGWRVSGWG